MPDSLTLDRATGRRLVTFIAGAGMAAASFLTIQHFFNANFPESIYKGSFCDISAFFNCNSSAYSTIAHFQGVPMGWLGACSSASWSAWGRSSRRRPSRRRMKALTFLNALGVLALFVYSVFFLKSLCLLCTGYYLFSFFAFFLFWKSGCKGFPFPSFKQLVVFGLLSLAGAYGFHLYYGAKQDAQLGGVAARVVKEYYSLEKVPEPELHLAFHGRPVHRPFRGRPDPGDRIRGFPLPRLPLHVRAAQPPENGVRRQDQHRLPVLPPRANATRSSPEVTAIRAPATSPISRPMTRRSSPRSTTRSSPISRRPRIPNGGRNWPGNTASRPR